MKKLTKILVLLLSVALILGAIAMVVSADTTEDIGEALTAADIATGNIKLESNRSITEQLTLENDLVIDLNGYTLTATTNAFMMNGTDCDFTIQGHGKLKLAGRLIAQGDGTAAVSNKNITVQGTESYGIKIEHTGTAGQGARIVRAVAANIKFSNVDIVSTAPYVAGHRAFFGGTSGTAPTWEFDHVTFVCDTAMYETEHYGKFNETPDSHKVATPTTSDGITTETTTDVYRSTGGLADAADFICLQGGGTVKITNSDIRIAGDVVNVENRIQGADSDQMVTIENSVLEAYAWSPAVRTFVIDGGTTAAPVGTVLIKNSNVASEYAIVGSADDANSKAKANRLTVKSEGSTLKQSGTPSWFVWKTVVKTMKTTVATGESTTETTTTYAYGGVENSMLTNNPNLIIDGASRVLSNKNTLAYGKGWTKITVGARFGKSPALGSANLFFDAEGNCLSTYTDVMYDSTGAVTTDATAAKNTVPNVTATGVTVLYDPMTDLQAPFVIVATKDLTEEQKLMQYGASFNYEEAGSMPFNQAAAEYNKQHGTNDFYYSKISNGKLSHSYTAQARSTNMQGTLTFDKSQYYEFTPFWVTGGGSWAHIIGNMTSVEDIDNTCIKWYIPYGVNEGDTTVSQYCADHGNKASEIIFNNVGMSLKDNSVVCGGFEFTKDSAEYIAGNFMFYTRDASAARSHYGPLTITSKGEFKVNKSSYLSYPASSTTYTLNDDWNQLSYVAVPNLGTTDNFADGVIYVYLNGEHIMTQNVLAPTATSDLTLFGIHMHADGQGAHKVGASMLIDNSYAFAYKVGYTAPQNAEAAKSLVPAQSNKALDTSYVASVGQVGYKTLSDAIEAAKVENVYGKYFDVVLLRDVEEEIIVDSKVTIWTNGYTLTPTGNSTSSNVNNDSAGNAVSYTFDPTYDTYELTYRFYTGDVVNMDETNEANWTSLKFKIGQTPACDFVQNSKFAKDGQKLYEFLHTGWVDQDGNLLSDTPLDANAVIGRIELEEDVIELLPVWSDEPQLIGSSYTHVVVENGIITRKGDENNKYNGWVIGTLNLQYGSTMYLNNNLRLQGSMNTNADTQKQSLEQIPYEKRTIDIDLNGYNFEYDPTGGGNDYDVFFKIFALEQWSVYSSVSGGKLDARGAHINGDDYENASAAANFLFSTASSFDGSVNTPELRLSESKLEKYKVGINLGKAEYSGNLTVDADKIARLHIGSEDSEININGVKVVHNSGIKNGDNALFISDYYNGNVNVTGTTIIDVESNSKTYVISSTGDGWLAEDNRPVPNFTFDNCAFVSVESGREFIGKGDCVGSVTLTNCVSNLTLSDDYNDKSFPEVVLGEGNKFYNIDTEAVTLADGVKLAKYNVAMDSNYEGTYKVLNATHTGGGTYTFSYTDCVIENLPALAYATAKDEDTVTVTFDGGMAEVYVKGGTVVPPANAEYTAFNVTYNGWNGSFEDIQADTNYVSDKTIVNTLAGLQVNLSLYSDFGINLYIPVKYENVVKVSYADKEITPKTTLDGEYLMYTAKVNATEAANNVQFVITMTEGGYTAKAGATISVAEYAERTLAGDYTNEDKALVKYIVKYANAACNYFGKANATLTTMAGENPIGGEEKSYTAIPESVKEALGAKFEEITVDISSEALAWVLIAKVDGTATINGKVYTFVAGDTVVVDGIRAYNFLDGINVDGTVYKYEYFAAYHYEKSAGNTNLLALIDALYEYAAYADTYI